MLSAFVRVRCHWLLLVIPAKAGIQLLSPLVIPAKAGIQPLLSGRSSFREGGMTSKSWIPAFAGMTSKGGGLVPAFRWNEQKEIMTS